MKYRTLGRTGIKVSPYCPGAMMFGGRGNTDHEDCARIMHKALDAGINFIDTADAYSRGESEVIVGEALKGRRDNVVLATKAYLPMGDDPNQRGNSRRWLVRALDDSLQRLQTDHVDLFQVHRPDPDTDVEETLSALTDLVRAGKVRNIGSSPFPASAIGEAQGGAAARGQGPEHRLAPVPGRGHRRGTVGRRAPRAGAVPRRAAAVLDPQPRDRARGAAGLRALRHGHPGLEPARAGPAHRPLPQGAAGRHAAGQLRVPAPERRAAARRRRAAHPPRRGRRAAPATPPPRAPRPRWPTRPSTGSTPSCLQAPTSGPWTWPTTRPPSSSPACAAD